MRRNSSNEVFLELNNVSSIDNGSVETGVFELGNIGSRGTTNPLIGCGIGDFAVWDRFLSDDEGADIFNEGPSSSSFQSDLLSIAPGPLVFYRFTEFETYSVLDEGSLGYHFNLRDFNFYAHEWR